MAIHSSILTWKVSWTEEPGSYSPRSLKESDTTKWLSTYIKYKIFQILLVNVRYLNFCIKDLVILNSVDVIIWQLAELNAISNIYLFFNWRVIALQNFIVFSQTSTWISHRCVYIYLLLEPPSHLIPHPTLLSWYRAPVWVSWAIQQIPIGYLFYIW